MSVGTVIEVCESQTSSSSRNKNSVDTEESVHVYA